MRRVDDSAAPRLGGKVTCHDPHLDVKGPVGRGDEEGIVAQGVDGQAEHDKHSVPPQVENSDKYLKFRQ